MTLTYIIFISILFSQSIIGEWKDLTSALNINQSEIINNKIYCATSGGLLIRDGNNFTTFTKVDGIKNIDIKSIGRDSLDNLWLGGGSPNGSIQIFNPIKKKTIQEFNFSLTEITNICISDTIAFCSYINGRDIGILKFIFDNDKWEYYDSFKNFPESIISINSILLFNELLLIGTNNGVLFGDLNNNLKSPNEWALFNSSFNSPVESIIELNGNIIFSDYNGLYEFDINTRLVIDNLNQNQYQYLKSDKNGAIWAINNKRISKLGNEEKIISLPYNLTSISFLYDNVILSSEMGFFDIDTSEWIYRKNIPNAPRTGNFSSITILDDGRFVGASAWGLSIYENQVWRNILEILGENTMVINKLYDFDKFVADTIEFDFGAYIADIEKGSEGKLYLSVRGVYPEKLNPYKKGGGVIIINVDNPSEVSVIDTSILDYFTTSSNIEPYMVVKDVEIDNFGNIWIVNPYAINKGTPLHVINNIGESKSYGSNETSLKISQSLGSIDFDSWSRVWVSAFSAEEANLGIYPNGGLFMLDYNGEATNPTNILWNKIISEGSIWSLKITRNNRIYYLTPNGLNYFDIRNTQDPIISNNLYPFFPNISFGDGSEIKLDPNGNVWIHSVSQGVHVLLENNTYWPDINGLRSSNSPLLSDQINDIAFDEIKGLAYIATNKGVSILKIPFKNKEPNYSNVKIFPSPFITGNHDKMIITNLMLGSNIKIHTLDGKLIAKITGNGKSIDGYQLSWDGKDSFGDFVSSGVYLLSIYDDKINNLIKKITVINKI